MGIHISETQAYFEFNRGKNTVESPRQVLLLAEQSLNPLLSSQTNNKFSHLIIATTCPDMLAPSLGQMLTEKFSSTFAGTHTIDVVQGCAGGVSALILGSQLATFNQSSVVVVQADAAQKATSRSSNIYKIFGNGSFACRIDYDNSPKTLLYSKSQQYKGLSEVVTVKLGHDANDIIMNNTNGITKDPRKYLGLSMNHSLALRLLRNAESFYLDFVNESTKPDVMILHQVNPLILKHLQQVFSKYNITFVDSSALTGNCGAASVGIAFHRVIDTLKGKKVMLCSFGTGGVITAGLWQN